MCSVGVKLSQIFFSCGICRVCGMLQLELYCLQMSVTWLFFYCIVDEVTCNKMDQYYENIFVTETNHFDCVSCPSEFKLLVSLKINYFTAFPMLYVSVLKWCYIFQCLKWINILCYTHILNNIYLFDVLIELHHILILAHIIKKYITNH